MTVKQIIIVRKDLKNTKGEKVRTGKLVAQGCHASNAVLLKNWHKVVLYKLLYKTKLWFNFALQSAWFQWINGSFTKICVYVNNEAELLEVYNKANSIGLPCALITDKGATEFGGVPTNTAVAIGPCYSEDLIGITDKLSLF